MIINITMRVTSTTLITISAIGITVLGTEIIITIPISIHGTALIMEAIMILGEIHGAILTTDPDGQVHLVITMVTRGTMVGEVVSA
jgi:hypothetical protein